LDNKDKDEMSEKLAMISSKYYVSNEKVSELQKTLSIARNVSAKKFFFINYKKLYYFVSLPHNFIY